MTKVCNIDPEGDGKVLEAISTMRIIFGESVRFKLLISVLNSANGSSANGFESTVLMFLNSLLAKCPDPAERVRLQCELEEAGLDLVSLEKVTTDFLTCVDMNVPQFKSNCQLMMSININRCL